MRTFPLNVQMAEPQKYSKSAISSMREDTFLKNCNPNIDIFKNPEYQEAKISLPLYEAVEERK